MTLVWKMTSVMTFTIFIFDNITMTKLMTVKMLSKTGDRNSLTR